MKLLDRLLLWVLSVLSVLLGLLLLLLVLFPSPAWLQVSTLRIALSSRHSPATATSLVSPTFGTSKRKKWSSAVFLPRDTPLAKSSTSGWLE